MQPAQFLPIEVPSVYASDPLRKGDQSKLIGTPTDPRISGFLLTGVVVSVMPGLNMVEVSMASVGLRKAIVLGGNATADLAFGANTISAMVPGCAVACWVPYTDGAVYVIGTLPSVISLAQYAVPDFILMGSAVGQVEDIRRFHDNTPHGVENRTTGAADQLPGDWGTMSSLGIGVIASHFHAQLRASDNCGLWAFYFDNLLRMHGYNLEQFTSATEHRVFNDEGEVHDVLFRAKYPWEALGLLEPGNAMTSEAGTWEAGNPRAYYEPQKDDQTGAWRHHEYRGFLGDIYREQIALPAPQFKSDPCSHSDQKEGTPYSGLAEVTKTADGRIGIRSAKEIIICKYGLLPVPGQANPPDHHKDGDWNQNYKASDKFGTGSLPEQKEWKWETEEGDVRSGCLLDYLAYTFNWYKLANFAGHTKDWNVPEESDSGEHIGITRGTIDPSKLQPLSSTFWADMPTKRAGKEVDHRMNDVDYYESMSGLSFLDDGSVIIEDGWGSQIIMSRGNITITAAGDVFTRPGRSFTVWAPGDAVVRAGRSVDITASKRDVRIKAQKNMHILAGNDTDGNTTGGILLESRAKSTSMDFEAGVGEEVQSSGVMIKAQNSHFATWSTDCYIGIHKIDEKEPKFIVLDAYDGKKDIITKSRNFYNMLNSNGMVAFDFGSSGQSDIFTKEATLLESKYMVHEGTGLFNGSLVASGTVGGAQVVYGGLKPIKVQPAGPGLAAQVRAATVSADIQKSYASDALNTLDDVAISGSGRYGDPDTYTKVGFSLRSTEQYRGVGTDFTFFSARWQQMLEESGSPETWKEPEVTAPTGDKTYPMPGRLWVDTPIYYKKPVLNNFDASSGYANARGANGYTENTPNTGEIVVADDAYTTMDKVE